MKIHFDKEYPEGTRWSKIVLDFCEILSKAYEYTIDEYDLASMVWQARLDKLSVLLDNENAGPTIHRLFSDAVRRELEHKQLMSQARQEYKEALTLLMPKDKFKD